MKKFLLILMVFLVVVPVFAQNDRNDQKDPNDQNEWENNRRMAVTFNPNTAVLGTIGEGIGISVGFEYAFLPQLSLKPQLYFLGFSPTALFGGITKEENPQAISYRFSLEGRWYPTDNYIQGFFANGGLQYQGVAGWFSWDDSYYDGPVYYDDPDRSPEYEYINTYTKFKGDNTVGVFAGLGYKIVIGKQRTAFVIEPAFDWIWSLHFGNFGPPDNSMVFPNTWILGMQGFRFTVFFGAAF